MGSLTTRALELIALLLIALWSLSPSSTAGGNTIELNSSPDCVSWGHNRIDCFARSTDNAIWHTWFDGTNWWAWESLGGTATSGPSVASWGVGHLDVFIKGKDNALWHKWTFDPAKGWSDWLSLGGVLTSDPDCVSRGSNRIECLATQADNAVWRKWYNGTTWDNPWESLGGSATSGPTAASWAANHLDVFVRSTDGALWHKYFLGGPWSNWLSLGGTLTSDPDCVSWGQNRIDCFARSTDNAIWHTWFDGTWNHPWESLGGVATSGPSVASWGAGHLDVFIKGTDNALWHKWTFDPAKGWSDWLSIPMVYQVTTVKPPPPATVVLETDWAALSVAVSPATPNVGDAVTFTMDMTALSTSMSFPQDVVVECYVDPPASGFVGGPGECFFGTVTFPGPKTGVPFTVVSKTPWTATPGTHTLMWDISTKADPSPNNNRKTISFTVLQGTVTFQFDYKILVSPKEQTVTPGGSAVYTVSVNLIAGPAQDVALSLSGPADIMAAGMLSAAFNPSVGKPDPTFSSTLTITTTSSVSPGRFSMTVTGNGGGRTHTATFDLVVLGNPATVTSPTSSSTSTTGTGGPPDFTWPIIGILALIVILLVALALRRRKPTPPAAPQSAQTPPPTPASESKPSSLFCPHCGTENPSTDEFCGECGERLSHHSG